jgi:hypothetical protein
MKGFTANQLMEYIRRQLGWPIWIVEMDPQQILDCIQDAMVEISKYRPRLRYGGVRLIPTQSRYLVGAPLGFGVVQVEFVDQLPTPMELFYGNLIWPAPLLNTGLDDYDCFMRWRKTWMRVTSVQPDWMYSLPDQTLYLYNPIQRYHAGILAYDIWDKVESLEIVEADWVKRFSLAKSRYLYGDILLKYSGAIPGPVKDIQLDSGKRAEGEKQITALLQELRDMQTQTPIMID